MKHRLSTLLTLMLLLSCGAFSQENIRKDIMSFKDSDYDFVNKGRRLLIEHLKSGDLSKALDVKNELLKEFEGKVSEVFYISEYLHLLYWLEDFDEILNYMKQVDPDEPVSNNVAVSAQTDKFFSTVYENTAQNLDIIEFKIKNDITDKTDRDFLILLITDISYIRSNNPGERKAHIDKVNKLADEYLREYPDSSYEGFIRKHIRFAFKESDHGFYMDVGFGAVLLDDKLSNQFGNGAAMDILFEYRHRKLMGMIGFGFTGHGLKNDFQINNTTWEKGSSATFGFGYLNAGYLLFENNRWSVYPLAGVGYGGFSANEKEIKENENLKKLKMNTFFPQIGIGLDFKFNISAYSYSPYGTFETYGSRISLKYTYRMLQLDRKDPLLKGHQHLITLSLGIGGRGKVRDY